MASWSVGRRQKKCDIAVMVKVPRQHVVWANYYGEARFSPTKDDLPDPTYCVSRAAAVAIGDPQPTQNYTVSWYCRSACDKSGLPYSSMTMLFARREIRICVLLRRSMYQPL